MKLLAILVFENNCQDIRYNQGPQDLQSNILSAELSEYVDTTYISLYDTMYQLKLTCKID